MSNDAQVPNRALNAAAIEMGIAEPSDLIKNKEIPVGDDTVTIPEALPDKLYNATLRQFQETFGVTPGRDPRRIASDFEVPTLTREESVRRFGERFLDGDPVRDDESTNRSPRDLSSVCYEAYTTWCEINDVSPKQKQDIAEMVENIDAEKKRARITINGEDSRRMCIVGAELTEDGWWLFNHTTNPPNPD